MPFQRSLYPKNWKEISLARREAAGWKCEWCGAAQGEEKTSARGKPYKVVLTVAHTHLDGGRPGRPLGARADRLGDGRGHGAGISGWPASLNTSLRMVRS